MSRCHLDGFWPEIADRHRRTPPPPCREPRGYPRWPTYKVHGRLRPAFGMAATMLAALAKHLRPDICPKFDHDFRPMGVTSHVEATLAREDF